MLIESVAPVFKLLLSFQRDTLTRRLNARALYERTGNLGERVLVPVGRDEYDLLTLAHLPVLSAEASARAVRAVAHQVDLPVEALVHPEMVRNRVFVFVVDHFESREFIKGWHEKWGRDHVWYLFYSWDMGDRQIISRLRTWIGNQYAWRSRGLQAALTERGIQPYGQLPRLLEMWDAAARILRELGHRYFEKWRAHPDRPPLEKREDLGLARESARALLDVLKADLPRIYPIFRGMIAMYYPEFVKGPHGRPLKGAEHAP